MHNTCSLPGPVGESPAYLQDKLNEWREHYFLLAHKYNEMVWHLQESHDAFDWSLQQIYELKKVNMEFQKKLKQSMVVNQAINEQRRALNQASPPAFVNTSLHISSDESLGQGYVLWPLAPEYKQDGMGSISVICARCLTSIYQNSISLKPTITEPLDARVSQEVNRVFMSASTATDLQNISKGQGEAYGLITSVHKEAFPATSSASSASCDHQRSMLPNTATDADVLNSMVPPSPCDVAFLCGGCVACNFWSNVLPKQFSTEPCNASVPPSNNCVFLPAYLNFQQNHLMPMPHVNALAEAGNGAVPFATSTLDEITERGRGLCYCEATTCDLSWNKLDSPVLIDRGYLKEQQSVGQCRSPLPNKASPLCQCGPDFKGVYESFSMNGNAEYGTDLEGHNVGMASPTWCNQFYDENGRLIINSPKCISIRADCHTGQVKVPISNDENGVKVASNTTGIALLPIDRNKSYGHRHQDAPTLNQVQDQTKVVALAENLACLAFQQGMYKTEMCNKWLRSMGQYCAYGNKCQFAHGPHELRPVLRHRRYKTILCRMVAAGKPCPYEHRCHFRHVT